jgi:hypothetical protein
LGELVRACFTGIWIESHEHPDALASLAQLCRQENWSLASWDVDQGLRVGGAEAAGVSAADPLAAVRAAGALRTESGTSLVVLVNFHRFLQSAEVVQALARQIMEGKQTRTIYIVLAPVVRIPVELEKLFTVVEHELPDRAQLAEIARGVATEPEELPEEAELEAILDAASGLTRYEAEAAFSLALVREGRLEPEPLWEQKAQMLRKSGTLALHQGYQDFGSLGGMSALKAFTKRALLRSRRDRPHVRARGILLLSPPGCGKSQFAKTLGEEVGRPTLTLDVGALMGSLVGQSEQRTREALRIADAMAPCVLFLDEVEKAFAGVGSSGQTDSGVSARMFGAFLSWLNDHDSDVFVVCTANDMSKLPPEFGRSERFDGIFFLDLPSREEKDLIWKIYLQRFALDAAQRLPADESWTGAEIKSCCRLAALLDLPLAQAAQNVVPIAVTAAESIERLRAWASGRCLAADRTGIYQAPAKPTTRRRVSREPSDN